MRALVSEFMDGNNNPPCAGRLLRCASPATDCLLFHVQRRQHFRIAYIWHGLGFTGVWELDQQVELKSGQTEAGSASRQGSCLKAWVVNYLLHCEGLAADGESITKSAVGVCKAMATGRRRSKDANGRCGAGLSAFGPNRRPSWQEGPR